MGGRRLRGVALVAVGLIAALGVGACSAGGDGGSDSAVPAADEGAAREQATVGGADGDQAAAGGTGGADLRVDQRSIIYTGTMQVRVDDVEAAAREATTAVTAAGGFVGADRRSSRAAEARAALTLRVPADRFTAVIDRLAGLGRQERREIRTEDVTEQVVDLDARIATQRARVESARKLLARATSVDELVRLENEVGSRQADLASLEARKRRLADLTALSTITVTFLGQDASTAEEEADLGFLSGLGGGWSAFLASARIALTVLGAVLPFAVVIGVPLWLLLLWRRRCGPGGRRRPAWARCRRSRPGRPVVRSARRRQCPQRGLDHEAYAGLDGALVHVERGPVQVDVGPGAADAETGERAGHVLQVPGEVLAAHALRRLGDAVGAERRGGGGGEHADRAGVVASPGAGRAGIPGRRWRRWARARPGPPEPRSRGPGPRCRGPSRAACRRAHASDGMTL